MAGTSRTGAGQLTIPLPAPARAGTTFPITCVNGSGAEPLYAVALGSGLVIAKSGGGTVILNGTDLFFNGAYEAA